MHRWCQMDEYWEGLGDTHRETDFEEVERGARQRMTGTF